MPSHLCFGVGRLTYGFAQLWRNEWGKLSLKRFQPPASAALYHPPWPRMFGFYSAGCREARLARNSSYKLTDCYRRCGDDWLIAGDYCAATCGRCATIEACDDLPPPFEACDSVAAGGKCKDPMVTQAGWCRRTCGVCKPTDAAAIAAAAVAKNATACDPSRPCTDLQPPGSLSCQDHFDMGDCAAVWMRNGGFCAQTCGRCTLPTVPLAL